SPAEFLAETRGEPISDKALELLAAERGCDFYFGEPLWYINSSYANRCAYSATSEEWCTDKQSMRESEIKVSRRIDFEEFISSPVGKRHREAIEKFILSLPVVAGESETKPVVECWKRTSEHFVSCLRVGDCRVYIDTAVN